MAVYAVLRTGRPWPFFLYCGWWCSVVGWLSYNTEQCWNCIVLALCVLWRKFHHQKLVSLCYKCRRTFMFILLGGDLRIGIHCDNASFLQCDWEAKYEKSVQSWNKKSVGLNAMSLKKYCTSSNSVFPMWHLHPRFTCSLYCLIQDVRCLKWWEFILGLG
jgi:hypothetical protein